jgi:hypothetical protein
LKILIEPILGHGAGYTIRVRADFVCGGWADTGRADVGAALAFPVLLGFFPGRAGKGRVAHGTNVEGGEAAGGHGRGIKE